MSKFKERKCHKCGKTMKIKVGNVQEVVCYDQNTGRKWFDVINVATGQPVPNKSISSAYILFFFPLKLKYNTKETTFQFLSRKSGQFISSRPSVIFPLISYLLAETLKNPLLLFLPRKYSAQNSIHVQLQFCMIDDIVKESKKTL